MGIKKTEVTAPNDYFKSVRIDITNPAHVNIFVTVFREMAVSAINENEYIQAEELLSILNQLNEARNVLLDKLAEERDGGEI